MKEVTHTETRSCRSERTISIFCSSLQLFSQSPGSRDTGWRVKETRRWWRKHVEQPQASMDTLRG